MTNWKPLILTPVIIAWLVIVLLTPFSLVGFWTDAIFFPAFTIWLFKTAYRKDRPATFPTALTKLFALLLAGAMVFLGITGLANPFVFDFFKIRSFRYLKVEGRIFHAYFKPVGAYSGGQGNFWITESPVFFPLIEKKVYYEHAVHHDFNDDEWEGQPVDNYKIAKDYIREKVIEKNIK